MLDKFAEELHQAREKSGISLQQMALKTRVDIKFLEAIDKGDFGFLPEPYVKAFLKDYAKMVGLDENKVVQKYEAAKKGKIAEEKIENESAEKPIEKKHHQSKAVHTYDATPPKPSVDSGADRRSIVLNGVIIAGAIGVIFIIYILFFNNSNEIVVSEKSIDEIIEDSRQRFEEPEDSEFLPVISDSLILTILSSDTVWVQIVFDDKKQEEFTLLPNSQKMIKSENNFKLTLGNSGAVSFLVNNKPLDYKGSEGIVSYVQITKDGLTKLSRSPALR